MRTKTAGDALLQLNSVSAEQTRRFGVLLGKLLSAGDVIGLIGSLGAGKTEFARGVAAGLDVAERDVASPTFAIVYPYTGRLPLYHADFYRLSDYDELYATGFVEMLSNGDGAVIIEWLDRIPDAAPSELMVIRLAQGKKPNERTLTVEPRGARYRQLAHQWVTRARADRKTRSERRHRGRLQARRIPGSDAKRPRKKALRSR
jgi:tRNA threonylcarbamoyladenosine biosynthesis protein TsaE